MKLGFHSEILETYHYDYYHDNTGQRQLDFAHSVTDCKRKDWSHTNYIVHIGRAADTAPGGACTGMSQEARLSDITACIVEKKEIVTRRAGHIFSW